MRDERPTAVAIDPDGFSAEYVGRLPDGRQFFLTWPFVPGLPDDGRHDYTALYLFDADGRFLDAQIEELPSGLACGALQPFLDARLAALGEVSYERIEVQPFEIERFGERFGLIAEFDDEADMWWVSAEPGNYMAFAAPWDSGVYDT